MKSHYFEAEILISDGELETSTHVIIEAENLHDAKNQANLAARRYFNKPAYKSYGWWYCPEAGRSVKADRVRETNAERFLRSRLMAA